MSSRKALKKKKVRDAIDKSSLSKEIIEMENAIRRKFRFLELASEACCEIGNMLINKENYEKAINEFSDAIKLFPNGTKGHICRGELYFSLGEFGLAINDFTNIITIDPSQATFYLYRAKCHTALKDIEKAILDFNVIIELEPKAVAYMTRGSLYEKINDHERAKLDFDRAIELDPEILQHELEEKNIIPKSTNPNKNKEYLRDSKISSKVSNPNEVSEENIINRAKKVLGESSDEESNPESMNKKKEISIKNIEEIKLLKRKGEKLLSDREYDEALYIYCKLIDLNPNEAETFFCRGNCFLGMGNFCCAYADYSDSLKLISQNPNPVFSSLSTSPSPDKKNKKNKISNFSSYNNMTQVNKKKFIACALYNRGLAGFNEKMYEQSTEDFSEYLRLNIGPKENKDALEMIKKIDFLQKKDIKMKIMKRKKNNNENINDGSRKNRNFKKGRKKKILHQLKK